jgi:hypothetical protein
VSVSSSTVEPLSAHVTSDEFEELVTLLTACVHGGASMGFLASILREDAEAYWKKALGELASGTRVILVRREGRTIVGSAQLALEMLRPA